MIIVILTFILTIAVALIEFFGRGIDDVYIAHGIITPIFLFIPLILFFLQKQLQETGVKTIKKLYGYFFVIILINAPGNLILHEINIQYDRFLHLAMGFLILSPLMLFCVLISKMLHIEITNHKLFLKTAFLVAFIGLFLFEGLQYTTDQIFGTKFFFDATQNIKVDFFEDIVLGFVGLFLTFLYYLKLPKKLNNILTMK
jgi:hypothetical protein